MKAAPKRKAQAQRIAANDPRAAKAHTDAALGAWTTDSLRAYKHARTLRPEAAFDYLVDYFGTFAVAAVMNHDEGSREQRRSRKYPSATIIALIGTHERLQICCLEMYLGRWQRPQFVPVGVAGHAVARAMQRTTNTSDVRAAMGVISHHVMLAVRFMAEAPEQFNAIAPEDSIQVLTADGALIFRKDEFGVTARTWVDASQYHQDQRDALGAASNAEKVVVYVQRGDRTN